MNGGKAKRRWLGKVRIDFRKHLNIRYLRGSAVPEPLNIQPIRQQQKRFCVRSLWKVLQRTPGLFFIGDTKAPVLRIELSAKRTNCISVAVLYSKLIADAQKGNLDIEITAIVRTIHETRSGVGKIQSILLQHKVTRLISLLQ